MNSVRGYNKKIKMVVFGGAVCRYINFNAWSVVYATVLYIKVINQEPIKFATIKFVKESILTTKEPIPSSKECILTVNEPIPKAKECFYTVKELIPSLKEGI